MWFESYEKYDKSDDSYKTWLRREFFKHGAYWRSNGGYRERRRDGGIDYNHLQAENRAFLIVEDELKYKPQILIKSIKNQREVNAQMYAIIATVAQKAKKAKKAKKSTR